MSGGFESSTNTKEKKRVLICLLRLDLRIQDNPLFYYAHQSSAPPPTIPSSTKIEANVKDERCLYSTADFLLPVFVFDEREIELSGLPGYKRQGPEARTQIFGFWKTGGFRARFVSESVYDLRSRLREAGSDLLIRFGRPEDVIHNLVKGFQEQGDEVEAVWMQKEMTSQEVRVEGAIKDSLDPMGVPLYFVQGKSLIHHADLPFEVSETPDIFTPFRKRVEALGSSMVRQSLPTPKKFKRLPDVVPKTPDYALDVSYEVDVDGLSTSLPERKEKTEGQISFHDILRFLLKPLNDASLPYALESTSVLQQRHPASAFPLRGGESSASERLEWYFVRGKSVDSSRWGRSDPPPVARYKQTRNNLIGHAYSTKMSPFLAYGSISPRVIWEALNDHERKFGEDQNTYWVRFELLWRDYFFFVAEKYGDLLFDLGGFEKVTDPRQAERKLEPGWWKEWDPSHAEPSHVVNRVLEGRTGIPFIDANILELRESGFMSNRGRQNVASFLAKDLGYDWRIGAEFFQSHLIDYDPTSNYGNWQYVAGVGNDPRASRQFNSIKQAKDYDSHGEYVKLWIPALRSLPTDFVHTPWLLDPEERRRFGLKTTDMDVTIDAYPMRPILEHETWKKHYERKEGVGSKMYGNPQEKVKDGKVKRYKKPIPPKAHAYTPRSSTMAPNFLPPLPSSSRRYSSSDSAYNGRAELFGASSGSSSPDVAADNERDKGNFRAVRGQRGSLGQHAFSNYSQTPSGTSTPVSAPSLSSNGFHTSARSGQRGFVGGVLPAATGPSTNKAQDKHFVSKADQEPSWRRS